MKLSFMHPGSGLGGLILLLTCGLAGLGRACPWPANIDINPKVLCVGGDSAVTFTTNNAGPPYEITEVKVETQISPGAPGAAWDLSADNKTVTWKVSGIYAVKITVTITSTDGANPPEVHADSVDRTVTVFEKVEMDIADTADEGDDFVGVGGGRNVKARLIGPAGASATVAFSVDPSAKATVAPASRAMTVGTDYDLTLTGQEVSDALDDVDLIAELGECQCAAEDFTVLKVELTNLKFNHDTGSSASDAINIRQDYNTAFDISNGEWVKGGTNIPACYTTNKAVTIKTRFTVQPASITSADIWAISTDSGGSLGDVIKTNVTFSGGVSSPEYVTFQVSGTTPNCIQKTTNDVWQWKMENVNGTGTAAWDLNTSGVHTVYTILNEPATPWVNTAGNALNVWTRILDRSCSWANGCVTGSAVLSNIVTQSYSMGVVYDGAQHYTYPGYTQFHLQALVDDLDAVGTDNMDCRDFANWTHTLSGSVGESAQYRVVDRTTSPYYFTYNYILPSGHSNWNTDNWNFHQVGWWNSRVCDASLKLDNDSDPTQGPGNSNHVEKLSVGDMTQTDYLDKLTETPDVTDIETGTCVLQ